VKPLTVLQPVLSLLASNLDILPAIGGAVEDLLRPDVDEREAMLINRDSREVTDFLETPRPDVRYIYRSTPPLYRPQKHLYQYFIDGSIRTYYIATGIESSRSFPIELAQIGAAVMQRDDRGRVRPLGVTACNPNGPGRQSPLFRDHIIGIYRHSQDHIPCQ
jgi:hypothetical protein